MNDHTSPFKAGAVRFGILCIPRRYGHRGKFQAVGLRAGSALEPHARAASGRMITSGGGPAFSIFKAPQRVRAARGSGASWVGARNLHFAQSSK